MMNGKKTEPEEPLSRESEPLYRQAAEILRDRILKGEYPPGTMIPSERELGNSLGISRIPIRDAIKSLQYIGIVNQVKGKGVVVQKLDPGQVLAKVGPFLASPDLLDIRIAVEQVSVREAARKGTPEDFDELSRLIAVLRSEASEKEKEDAGRQFHLKIAEIGDNQIAVILWHFFDELLKISRSVVHLTEAEKTQSYEEHEELLRALRMRDGDKAAAIMKAHLETTRRELAASHDASVKE